MAKKCCMNCKFSFVETEEDEFECRVFHDEGEGSLQKFPHTLIEIMECNQYKPWWGAVE